MKKPEVVRIYLHREMQAYLDTLIVTDTNIGEIRRSLLMPFDTKWNGLVRDETAQREEARHSEIPAV